MIIKQIHRLLIANRGEIASRIIETAKAMGITTIAIYSKADANAKHTQLADEAYCVGDTPVNASYLNQSKILEIAKQYDIDAIHPGYGFLSENAVFAKACHSANIIFVGPRHEAITAMGSKSNAKQIMEKAAVPLLPGYHGEEQSEAFLLTKAREIGFPIMLKASAGGGGKGMRIVDNEANFSQALQAAKREAKSSVGDEHMLLEKYISAPRHIEIQIIADHHGNYIHLLSRDCSIQRRHQKIIEEAPGMHLSPSLTAAMGEAAIAAASAIQYTNAGTVEFLLDENDNFYFMEMNTRLQVEHPVTEMITGLDLVELQLQIAMNEPLAISQTDVDCLGYAIELRIYAEDPYQQFLPQTGKVTHLQYPDETEHWRIDSGIDNNSVITSFYDPMIAKLISFGENREQAILHMQQLCHKFQLCGVTTNLNLLIQIINEPDFQSANITTNYIPLHETQLLSPPTCPSPLLAAAVIIWQQRLSNNNIWQQYAFWQMNLPHQISITLKDQYHCQYALSLAKTACGYQLTVQNDIILCFDEIIVNDTQVTLLSNDTRQSVPYRIIDNTIHLFAQHHLQLSIVDVDHQMLGSEAQDSLLQSPMPGTITSIAVTVDQIVTKGTPLLTLEAMKMEHTITAPYDGTVTHIPFTIGELVAEGIELIELTRDSNG